MFILFFILPALVCYYMYHKDIISAKEDALLFLGVTCVLVTCLYFGMMYAKTHDTLILNGSVTSKRSEHVSCSHSYSCNCTRDSKGNTSCQTCYEHSFDIDWNVYSDVGGVTISRVDRQGLLQPNRWSEVIIGEPFSSSVSYTNYVLGEKNSLFNYGKYNKEWVNSVPEYPVSIYDYYRANRIIQLGTSLNTKPLDNAISEMLKTVGPNKQANVILVTTNNQDPSFHYSVRDKWINGKKNDIVVVLGMNNNIIKWVESFSWNKNAEFPIKLQKGLINKDIYNTTDIISVLNDNITKYYVRKPMKEFEYLSSNISLDLWQIMLVLVLSALSPIALHKAATHNKRRW